MKKCHGSSQKKISWNFVLSKNFVSLTVYIGCSFKFLLKVDVEESIVNAPVVSLQSKNTNDSNDAKSEVIFK
jgi:hypothetical protein